MSSNCAKCGAELIGSRKFCTACGAPVVDPRAKPASEAPAPLPVLVQSAETVNPFAVTAGPNVRSPIAAPSAYGPPPGQAIITPAEPMAVPAGLAREAALSATETDPNALPMLPASPAGDASAIPSVSPLAVSGLVGTEQERHVVAAARDAVDKAEAAAAKKKALGTQMMPSAPRPRMPSAPEASSAPSRRPDRTHVMAAVPSVPLPSRNVPAPPRSAPSTSKMAAAPAAPPPAGSSPTGPSSAPGSGRGSAPPPVAVPAPWSGHPAPGSHVAPQTPASVAQGPAPWPQPAPWSAPAPYASYPPVGYVPGSRVLVTWANGQRFPATVQQVTPAQCLVVFDNGQQQWVDLPYLSPA